MKFQGVMLVSLVLTQLSSSANPPPTKFIKEVVKKGSAGLHNAAARSTRSSLYSSVVPAPQYKISAQYAQQLQEHYAQQLAQYPSLSLGSAGSGGAQYSAAALRAHKKPLFNPQPLHSSVLGEVSLHSPKTVVLDATDAIQSHHPHYAPEYGQAAYRALKAAYAGHTSPAAAAASLTNDEVKLSDAAVLSEPKLYKSPSLTYTPPAAHQALHAEAATSQIYRGEEHADKEDHYASKYHFGYQVRDPKHGSYFGHSEARDGHVTKGQYHVLLPDGRLQNVLYYADPTGFHARVSYNGVARHADSHTLAAHAV